jgi:hypothetical protein
MFQEANEKLVAKPFREEDVVGAWKVEPDWDDDDG